MLALRDLPPLRLSTNTLEEFLVIKNLTIGSIIAGLCSASSYAQMDPIVRFLITRYIKDFVRNREAFAYDKDNPNSGHHYQQPPPRKNFGVAPQLKDAPMRSD